MLRCNDISGELDAYLDGELEEERAAGIASHLEDCPSCRRKLAERRSVALAVKRLPAVKAPDGFATRFRTARQAGPAAGNTVPVRRRRRLGWAIGSAAAAAAAVLMAAVFLPGDRAENLSVAGDRNRADGVPGARSRLPGKSGDRTDEELSEPQGCTSSKAAPSLHGGKKSGKAAPFPAGGKEPTLVSPPAAAEENVKEAASDRDTPVSRDSSAAPAKTYPEEAGSGLASKAKTPAPGIARKPSGYSGRGTRPVRGLTAKPRPAPGGRPVGGPGARARPRAVLEPRPPEAPESKAEEPGDAKPGEQNEGKLTRQRAYVLDVEVLRKAREPEKAGRAAKDLRGAKGGARRRLALRAESVAAVEDRLLEIARTLGGGRLGPEQADTALVKKKQRSKDAAAGARNIKSLSVQPPAPKVVRRAEKVAPAAAAAGGAGAAEPAKAETFAGKKSGRRLVLYLPADQAETFARALSLLIRTDVTEVKRFGTMGARAREAEVRKLVDGADELRAGATGPGSTAGKPGRKKETAHVLFVIELKERSEEQK